jgi:uncharacterized protein YbbC (DUF1343 family)
VWPGRVYASHPSAAFRIDVRIPRLYIAHGPMTYNESRPRMFPGPRLSILFSAAIILLCSAPNVRSLPQNAPGNTPSASPTQPGIDVLEGMNFAPLQGKHVGVITNQTGVDSQGRRTIDVLAHADGVKLVAIFSPEHGIAGKVDAKVENATDPATGLPVFSLYGDTRTPTDEMLKGIDALVFDLQDAGVRFYTYTSTMGYCMEAAAKHKIPFFVLDRPNPLGGERIEGPMLDKGRISFTGYFSMPIVYGMTLGELARMFNAENKTNAELHVVAMKNWRRSETYDQTGMKWIPPSPNLRTVGEDFIYPGIETLQPGGISVGRGTDTPFELFGAPWIQADPLLKNMEARNIPGARFSATTFTPTAGPFSGELCNGLKIEVTERSTFVAIRVALEAADALHRLYPDRFDITKLTMLMGSAATVDALVNYVPPVEIISSWSPDLAKFKIMSAKYYLYE